MPIRSKKHHHAPLHSHFCTNKPKPQSSSSTPVQPTSQAPTQPCSSSTSHDNYDIIAQLKQVEYLTQLMVDLKAQNAMLRTQSGMNTPTPPLDTQMSSNTVTVPLAV